MTILFSALWIVLILCPLEFLGFDAELEAHALHGQLVSQQVLELKQNPCTLPSLLVILGATLSLHLCSRFSSEHSWISLLECITLDDKHAFVDSCYKYLSIHATNIYWTHQISKYCRSYTSLWGTHTLPVFLRSTFQCVGRYGQNNSTHWKHKASRKGRLEKRQLERYRAQDKPLREGDPWSDSEKMKRITIWRRAVHTEGNATAEERQERLFFSTMNKEHLRLPRLSRRGKEDNVCWNWNRRQESEQRKYLGNLF